MFTEAHQDFHDSQTQGTSSFHSANAAYANMSLPEETTTALANLASATATDRAAMAALTNTNEQLSIQLSTITKSLTTALAKIQMLEQSLQSQPSGNTAPTQNHQLLRPYCWTHGFRVQKKHNSMTCKAPADGHIKTATAVKLMGGSIVGLEDVTA